ncbi:MAG: protein-glutamate O-methyltransferase CheR [Deltaproteobacteria bacterium]|nr:protein-glutamate O-methyltransferase CheR [Deltaproteobacteria bacterium]
MHGVHTLSKMQSIKDTDFQKIADIVHRYAGITLGPNKKNLVVSRLSGRLRQLEMPTFSEYVRYLRARNVPPEEIRHMINAITTNTTHFFREQHHFEVLENYLRKIVALKMPANQKRLRIWCAASSTGQEPYSIAMTVYRVFHGQTVWDLKIMASDIDTNVLTFASRGEYSETEMKNVSALDKARFFSWREATSVYTVKPTIRKLIVFRKINLIYDALDFNEPIDVVFCRNVMIYFSSENREALLSKLHRCLGDRGILFLGHSESIPLVNRQFEYVDTTVYRKRSPND